MSGGGSEPNCAMAPHPLLYVLIVACVYLEPLVIERLGTHCRGQHGYFDALWHFLVAPHLAVQQTLALRVLLLLLVYALVQTLVALAVWQQLRRREGTLWERLRGTELATLLLFSLLLHVLVCLDTGADPVDSGAEAVEILFSPFTPAQNRLFCPRLAWLWLLAARAGGRLTMPLLLSGSLLVAMVTQQLCFHAWLFSACGAWCLHRPVAPSLSPAPVPVEDLVVFSVDDSDDGQEDTAPTPPAEPVVPPLALPEKLP